ncbi:hypothetical protein IQ22_02309 [Pseudomonas duriflava]|uniref:Uncharacterized protein n=2 Tax=Pseudomonas duriflava TaxID=459528 RepID=A0A562QAG7_9PSED|nr:hypothetical protein IQ22_02309 [Pseudomonas duriflava]
MPGITAQSTKAGFLSFQQDGLYPTTRASMRVVVKPTNNIDIRPDMFL